MKLLELVYMMDVEEHYEVWSVSFFTKKRLGISVNERLAEELYKPVTKKFKSLRKI